MPFEQISKLGLWVFLFLGFYFYQKNKFYSLFVLLLISFGLNAFTALAGTLWFPYKVVMFATSLFAFKYSNKYNKSTILKPYYLLIVLSSTVAWIATPNVPGVTFLQGPMMRPVVQAYTYVTMALMVPFITSVINSEHRLSWSLKAYFFLSEFIIAVGLIHFVFILLGLPFLPILRPGGEASEFAAFGLQGTVVNRIYGLSGEPKTLATFILPYIFISFYNYIEGNYNKGRIFHITALVVSFIVMVYTFSSAILISAGIGLIIIPYLFRHRFGSKILQYTVIISIVGYVFMQSGDSFTAHSKTTSIENKESLSMMDVLYERSFGRVEKESEERYESVALDYMYNVAPEFLLTGFGLGMYNYHLPLPKHGRGVEPIDSGWVVILMDLGLLGFLFFFSIYNYINKLKNDNKFYNNIILNSYLIGGIVGFLTHIGNNGLYQIFLFLGLSMAAYNVIIVSQSKNGA
ncbi:O-antigen ligase family protein [Carboxylicivirga sp. M1479]|uniref:O-antigen ligase family protein n=1 Tax=Carboxylicivirga sp. M1479 TaxID=2594476 RepID=UPI001177B4F2|nr:O-antigen ligase family protein [Carboxylicivirga sp. M1479]TRX70556.1 hypothetical protein FNN09_11300 [Carboxylicivirga sp. M1479]